MVAFQSDLTAGINTAETFATGAANTAANTAQASAIATAEGYANSKFLPLAGGTLTGGLSGTTAAFSTVNSINPYQIGGTPVLSVPDPSDLFVGPGAGGSSNTGAKNNMAVGYQALNSNTTGIYNVASGVFAAYKNTTGSYNVAIGQAALLSNTSGFSNVAIGENALITSSTAGGNVAVGGGNLFHDVTGGYNTAVGLDAGVNLGTSDLQGGSFDIMLGFKAGDNFNASESNDIDIGNLGVLGDMGAIDFDTLKWPLSIV